jgi:hypothetical protein
VILVSDSVHHFFDENTRQPQQEPIRMAANDRGMDRPQRLRGSRHDKRRGKEGGAPPDQINLQHL